MLFKKLNNRQKGLLLNIVAIILIATSLIYKVYRSNILSFTHIPESDVSTSDNLPIDISIPRLDINLEVESHQISNGGWYISDNKAIHMTESAKINDESNIIIYAHNKNHLFGNLVDVSIQDEIVLKGFDGMTKKYIVSSVTVVSPNDISVIQPTNNEVLTLYTCTGFADSRRLVVRALPAS